MKGFGKAAGIGLASVFMLLLAMSAANVVFAMPVPGPLTVTIPTAELTGIEMYSGNYGTVGDNTPVIVQEVASIVCPDGQIITKTMDIGGITIEATISMATANMGTVFMKAGSVTSTTGVLTGVTLEVDPEKGFVQIVASGTMENLVSDAYLVTLGSLSYTGLDISVDLA